MNTEVFSFLIPLYRFKQQGNAALARQMNQPTNHEKTHKHKKSHTEYLNTPCGEAITAFPGKSVENQVYFGFIYPEK